MRNISLKGQLQLSDPLIDPKEAEKHSVGIQSLAAIGTILTALATMVASLKENQSLALVLGVGALLMIIGNFYKSFVFIFRSKTRQLRQNKMACAFQPELGQFQHRLRDFLNRNRSDTLVYTLTDLSRSNRDELAKVYGPDILGELLEFSIQQHNFCQVRDSSHLTWLIQELIQFVVSYNNYYVNPAFQRLRSQEWQEKLLDHHRRQIEDFRERWARFLDDLRLFIEKVNNQLGCNLTSYFERPSKL